MPTTSPAGKRRFTTRFLRPGDIPALLDLERRQWTAEQSASAEDFRARIAAWPELCGGAFCTRTGELLASVFTKPTTAAEWTAPRTRDWSESARLHAADTQRRGMPCLFGISLTSVNPDAALQLLAFTYLHGVRSGVKQVFLGSPMPGLKRHLERNPGACVDAYARGTRNAVPIDPQLRYYHAKGWKQIVSIRADYFPHADSLDYAAILQCDIDFAWLRPLLRLIPVSLLRSVAALAPRLAIPEGKGPRGRAQLQA